MSDGKVVIETDLDSSGIEDGLKKTQKSMKSQAATLAAEYRKQGMTASDAFKKAWSEIERSSEASAISVEKDWETASGKIGKAISKIGSIASKGLKIAATAIAGTATTLGGVATAAIKVGSDFEAQMSRVQAISGATGKELEELRSQAVQLGADTAFSASEAAQGMENLAAAGFETSEIMDAMPGLLDLAAASGEDLASSSDIAASTLRGFGLAASDAGHVADVLAENANRTNSSVSETGEAMKYIAPLARAAGISLEETAAAIGIMANAGIQGSQAGTTLRGALSRLSKPTDDMQQAMDELGISFYDSEGKMLSLADQVGMLQSAMEGMTDEQKNNYLVTLYGQEALSGMLALINEGPDSLASLTAAYEQCDGSAQTAAATMQDNLKGAVEELSGSAESLGIVFYDSVAGSLKEAAQSATDSVNNITDAFNNGGLSSAIEAAGNEFANLATAAAAQAPKMVDAAVGFIQSFVQGLVNNRGQLISAAGDMAGALASGLAELLPAQLQRPVDDAINAISESLGSGGLKKAGKTAVDTLDNVIDIVGKLAKAALPLLIDILDFAGENLSLVAAAATSAFTAFKGYKVVTNATKATKTLSATVKMLSAEEKANALQVLAASGALTAKEMIIGVLTGKITLATAAQTAWNAVMAANPIGLVITAVGALAAGLGIYALTTDDAADSTEELAQKHKENIEASREAIKAIEEEAAARQKNIDASTAEIDNAEALWGELSKIVDANGQIKDGYEARAEYITGELSDALGIEIGLVDGQITNYQELEDSIYDVIAAKKAEAMLSAMESDYTTAMQEQAEKAEALAVAYENLNNSKEKQRELETEIQELASSTNTADAYRYAEAKEELEKLNGEIEEQEEAFKAANTAMQDNQKVISDYNLIMEAAMSGNTDQINAALAQIQSGIDTTLEKGSAAAIEQANTTASTLTNIMQGEADGLYNLQEETKNSLAESMGMALNQVGTDAEKMKQVLTNAGEEGSAQIVAAMAQAKISGTLSAEAEAGMESFLAGFDGLDEQTKAVWSQAWYGALEGLEGFENLADPATEGVDAFLESLRAALEVHSPSQAVKRIFAQVWPGAQEGLEEGQDGLNTAGSTVIASFLATLSGSGILQGAKNIGMNIMSFFGAGVGSKTEDSKAQGKANADAANQGAASVDPTGTGENFGRKYTSGVKNSEGTARTGGKSLADNADSGAKSKTGYAAGDGFGAGFVSGIAAWIASAVSAGANLAASALQAAKDKLQSRSPAKKTIKLGRDFDQGFIIGVRKDRKKVEKETGGLAEAALKSFDLSDVSSRMRETMALNTGRIAKSFALESSSTILNRQINETVMRLSDDDIKRLAKEIGTSTGKSVAKAQNNKPIYLGTDRIDKPLPKGAVPRI